MTSSLLSLLYRLHHDERGDIPVGQLAVIGLVVIPLVIAMIAFRKDLTEWFKEQWEKINSGDTDAGW